MGPILKGPLGFTQLGWRSLTDVSGQPMGPIFQGSFGIYAV